MMRNILYLFLVSALGFACTSPKTLNVHKTESNKDYQDSLVIRLMKPFPEATQIAIGVVNKNKVDHFGYMKMDSSYVRVDNKKTLFEIGSITKVFTGIVLADAVLNKRVDLMDSLSYLLPYKLKNGQNITLKSLTTHTSGIFSFPLPFAYDSLYNEKNPYSHIDESMVQKYFENDFVPMNKVGEEFSYSNLGTGLLGYILSKQNSISLMECYESIILDPTEMYDTCLGWQTCESTIANTLVTENQLSEFWTFNEIIASAGGLLSNTVDMANFIMAVTNNNIAAIEKSKTPLFRMSEDTELCMNWFYSDMEGFGKWYWHGGGTGAFTSAMFIDDSTDNGIIVLSNVSAFHPKFTNIEKIAMEYLKYMNDNPELQ